jgi:polysaccharide export outer membrane protein
MKRQPRIILLAVALAGCLTGGCSYDSKELEAFLLKPRAPISGTEYRVLPPDVIQITSRQVTEIGSLSQQVRPDGKINLPLLEEIEVAGKTPKEIEKAIETKALEFYEKADVTVTVTGYNSQKYFVFGQVGTAGPIPWTGHDTLLDALAKAQPTYLAWPERIYVVRGDDPKEGGEATTQPSEDFKKTGIQTEAQDNPRHVIIINLKAMIEHRDMSNNILLKPNDVINVQPNPFAVVGLALESVLYPVRPILEAVRVPASISGAANSNGG